MHKYTKFSCQTLFVVNHDKGFTRRVLLVVAALTLLWGGSFATVSNAQSGEEEFQRKMNELKLHGNKPKQSSEQKSHIPSPSETEALSVLGVMRRCNFSAIPRTHLGCSTASTSHFKTEKRPKVHLNKSRPETRKAGLRYRWYAQ